MKSVIGVGCALGGTAKYKMPKHFKLANERYLVGAKPRPSSSEAAHDPRLCGHEKCKPPIGCVAADLG